MTVTEAIQSAVEHFRSIGNLTPSHCDVRCYINDAIDYNRYYKRGYDQGRAFRIVRNQLAA